MKFDFHWEKTTGAFTIEERYNPPFVFVLWLLYYIRPKRKGRYLLLRFLRDGDPGR